MSEFPQTFTIYCEGPGDAPHAREVLYERGVDLERGVMTTNRKTFRLDTDKHFDRLDTTQLRCPTCSSTLRVKDADLSRLVVACATRGELEYALLGN
ncbi:MAG: hypothetical protein ACRDS9_24690 [Pseudonocardiaceae bacterium]